MTTTLRELGKLGIAGSFVLTLAVQHDHLYYNATASAPIGYYWTSSPTALQRGDRALVCMAPALLAYAARHHFPEPPDARSPCYHSTEPFVKTIWGVAGDRFHVDGAGVWINDRLIPHTEPVPFDGTDGAQLPIPHDMIVPPGMVIAGSTADYSFDSRYAGPLVPFRHAQLLFTDPLVHAEQPTASNRATGAR
jgi:conjugative transfer signal peptidase TraF